MIDKIDFNYLGRKVYSATKTQKIYSTFVSNIVEGPEQFVRWHNITWGETKDDFSDVMVFIRSALTEEGLRIASWSGPFFDGEVELENQYGRYLQFCVLLTARSDSSTYPNVSNINLKYYTTETSAKFYTKTFNIGFTPKTAVLTYNANTTDDAIIRFSISGIDSIDPSYYQEIAPNKIVKLDSTAYLSDSIKVMMEIIGTSQAQVVVNEFALMFSGEDAFRLNKVNMESSSSTSSGSSSSTSTSSSSSIDSSSSSSSTSNSSSSSSSSSS